MNHDVAPLHNLVDSRRQELSLSWPDVVRRCGYENPSRGLRRLGAIWEGNLSGRASVRILSVLPEALSLDEEVVQAVVRQSRRQQVQTHLRARQAEATVRRAAFQPSAYLLGTTSRPSQITIFGLTGGADRWLCIPLDLAQPPITFVRQALAHVRTTPEVPFFGRIRGFTITRPMRRCNSIRKTSP